MRAKAPDSLILYLTQMGYDSETTYLSYAGDGAFIVETPKESQKLTVNAYEDIMEISPDGSKRVIAESNVHHNRDSATIWKKKATKWTLKEGGTV